MPVTGSNLRPRGLSRAALLALAAANLVFTPCLSHAQPAPAPATPSPLYSHVFVIVEENKDYELIVNGVAAPNIARLGRTYGLADHFYGEVHPSQGNYVALLGGDTFGIHDDDAWYCVPGSTDRLCPGAAEPGYQSHTVETPHLGDQLAAKGLTWKGYYENLPEPGSMVVQAGDPTAEESLRNKPIYAAKHSGFTNFRSAQMDPHRAQHLVGFDQLDADLKSGNLPNFALIIPNQCNEMHGIFGVGVPPSCDILKPALTVARGDEVVGKLVDRLMNTDAWRSAENMAIVITFDESGSGKRDGCCAVTPGALSNFGGGHIITVVITNHGPRGVVDSTPYNHYSLLRTLEDAFGAPAYLGHAADTDKGVAPMTRLFGGR